MNDMAEAPRPASATRITRTVHTKTAGFFGELRTIAPDLRVTLQGTEEEPHAIGFKDPDGEFHVFVVDDTARTQFVLAMLASLSEEGRAAVSEALTSGLVVAAANDLPE